MPTIPQPWLEDALEQLDLRRDDRCLVLGCPTDAHVAAVSNAVGNTAKIVVVEPDREQAERVSQTGAHENLEVLAYEPEGSERFGTFDALLACPLTTMGWSIDLWTELILHNLRPGGRFVLDLPSENVCDPLRRAWLDIGGEATVLARIDGPSEAELAGALRKRGLRNVEAALGTHLVSLESPYALAVFLLDQREADAATERMNLLRDLELTLVRNLGTNSDVDVVFHRTRIHGRR